MNGGGIREQYLVGPAQAGPDAEAALRDFMAAVEGMSGVTIIRPYQPDGPPRAVVETDDRTAARLRDRFRGRLLIEVDAPLRF